MLGRVKTWLGIEGVKLELVLTEEFHPQKGAVNGRIRLASKQPQTVTAINIVLVEKYTRGKEGQQLVDEYELGRRLIEGPTKVPGGGEPVEVDFRLPYSLVRSEVDDFGERNFLFGGLAWAARKLRGVKSEYRLEAEAQVRGVGLNPFDKLILKTNNS